MQVYGWLVQWVAPSQVKQIGCDPEGDTPQRERWHLLTLQFVLVIAPARSARDACELSTQWLSQVSASRRDAPDAAKCASGEGQSSGAQLDSRERHAVQADGVE